MADLRPSDVARALRVHVGTLRRWDQEGRLRPFTRFPGGQRRYAWADWLCGERTAAVHTQVRRRKQTEAGNLERQMRRLMEDAGLMGYRVVL